MDCPGCKKINETDAVFCKECGRPLVEEPEGMVRKRRKAYLAALLFLPVIIFAAAIGYYKFFLPAGVAAVVNGEDISLSELDAAVAREQGTAGPVSGMLRYEVLNRLITERIVLQEARKAGMSVSPREIDEAVAKAQAASGLDTGTFSQEMKARYGSMKAFRKSLEKGLLEHRFVAEKVVPPGAGPVAARRSAARWFRVATSRASVRIALAEQGGMAGNCDMAGSCAATTDGRDRIKAASSAGLRYWHERHGPGSVSARATDFGCHVRVEIMKHGHVIASLLYRDGNVSEQ